MKPDVFVGKFVGLRREEEVEERGVGGERAQVFAEEELCSFLMWRPTMMTSSSLSMRSA